MIRLITDMKKKSMRVHINNIRISIRNNIKIKCVGI